MKMIMVVMACSDDYVGSDNGSDAVFNLDCVCVSLTRDQKNTQVKKVFCCIITYNIAFNG